MIMNDKVYDVLKIIQRIVLPALATFYIGLGEIWTGIIDLPYPAQVSATFTLIATFLGALLEISNSKFRAEAEKEKE